MTTYTIIPPTRLSATIPLPASKSISNRALIINALSGNSLSPDNVSDCDDTRVMTAALCQMPSVIDIMAAGTAMRFLTAYLSVTPGTHTLTGSERMCHRPIGVLVDALRQLGAHISYAGEEGYPPLRISGQQLSGGALTLPGNVSSQYISALLMIAPTMQQGLQLELTDGIISRPYIDMTLRIMQQFGAQARWTSDNTLQVAPTPYQPAAFTIENDWSAASYWYQMVALSADPEARVELPGLFADSTQGDSQVARLFIPLGVQTQYTAQGVVLTKCQPTEGCVEMNLMGQPDLAQTLVVTASMLNRPFRFGGLQTLKIKETDRIVALQQELAKLGFPLQDCQTQLPDGRTDLQLCWDGMHSEPSPLPRIDTYDDHRMAMAFAPAALTLGHIEINNPEVVTKSYPTFWDTLESAGFEVKGRS